MRTQNVKKNMAGAKCEIKLCDDKLPGCKCYYTGGGGVRQVIQKGTK